MNIFKTYLLVALIILVQHIFYKITCIIFDFFLHFFNAINEN